MTVTAILLEKVGPCARFCVPYSAVGALFMFWVGMMITKQPFFLLGLEDVEECKQNAFGAMWLFIIIFLSSTVYTTCGYGPSSSYMTVQHADEYETRPILPRGMSDYEVNQFELSEVRGLQSDLREMS